MSNILLIDNLDSFTYNLVELLRIKKHKVIIFRNYVDHTIILNQINSMKNPILMFSPGPGSPSKAGNMPFLLKKFKGKIPIIGICLGHQGIIQAYGGSIKPAKNIVHGKPSLIQHDNQDMFQNLPNPLSVARYHSLICHKPPQDFVVTSKYKKITMSIKHSRDKICGFQFHPESILTPQGANLLEKTIVWINQN